MLATAAEETVLANVSTDEEALALAERELIGYRLAFAKRSGAAWQDTPSASWMRTGSRELAFNAVVRARFQTESVEASVHDLLGRFQGVPMRWMVPPSASPQNIGDLLVEAGFVPDEPQALMVADLTRMPALEVAADLTVEEVVTPRRLYDWVAVAGYAAAKIEGVFWAWLPLLLDGWSHHRFFLLRHGDVAVARAMLRTADGIAGLYAVHTAPGHRRRGFGTAATACALRAAREAGLRVTSLQASQVGEPLYRKLGYRTVGVVRCWARR